MLRVEKRPVIVFFALLLVLSFSVFPTRGYSSSGSVGVDNVEPTIGEYGAPSTVYAQQYVYLNWTVSNNNGKAVIMNSTLELSNGVIIAYDNTTDTFSEIQDTGNYLTLDASGSLRTDLNSTAFRLSARAMFGWNYTIGNIDIVSAKEYDDQGASGSGSKTDWFYFENDLIVYSASVDHGLVNPNDTLTFNGTVYYEGTTIPPAFGDSALSFDGVGDYVDCGNPSSLTITGNAVTLEAWINPNNLTRYENIIAKYNYSLDMGFMLIHSDAGTLDFYVGNDTSHVAVESNVPLSYGVLQHVVAVYDGVDLRIYVNGVLSCTPVACSFKIAATDQSCYIGHANGYNNFTGNIDEVRIYNRALSATEVSKDYQGIYSNESGLVLYLPFDGDLLDQSGQQNDGVAHGTTWTTGAYVKVNAAVELDGVLQQTVNIINAANGSFTLSRIFAPERIGKYDYNIYVTSNKNSVQNQTVPVIVRAPNELRIIDGGVLPPSVNLGGVVGVWLKIVYEYDNSTFDANSGSLYLNGSAMSWSSGNKRWELNYTPNATGQQIFTITSFLETKYGLNRINSSLVNLTLLVTPTPWFQRIVTFFSNIPVIVWMGVGVIIVLIIIMATLFRLGLIELDIKESTEFKKSSE